MDLGLTGRTVLITGASRNMGRAAALAFAAEGANLALCTSSKIEAQDAIADEARAHGVRVLSAKCDITDAAQVDAFVARAVSELGSVDVVVNIAGYRAEAPLLEETVENFNRVVAVNLTGPFNICRAAIPHMQARRWGRIVNISGVAPYVGGPAVKCMVKLGIVGLTRGIADEFGQYGITANCVGPGAIARESERPGEERPLKFSLPMGRKGTAHEAVSAMLFLASEPASYITGQCYLVNGGAYFS
jgi:3-oxoacyl-[acyl-carrier protein] reductase